MIQQDQLGKVLADSATLGDRILRLEKQNESLVDQNKILIDKIELVTNQNTKLVKQNADFSKINWSKLISPTESVHTQTEKLKTVDKEVNTFQTKTQNVDKETNTRIINFNDSQCNTDAPVTVDQNPKENIQYTSTEIQTVSSTEPKALSFTVLQC